MMPIPRGVAPARVALVPDGKYLEVLHGLVAGASRRLLCTVFIVDVSPSDRALRIDGLLAALGETAWRGVDTRLLIGGSRDNVALAEAADAARARARAHAIPCRWLTGRNVRGSHAKIVIADDLVLTGSHNWSGGAVAGATQTQDSVAVESPPLAAMLADRFEEQWRRAEAPHVAI